MSLIILETRPVTRTQIDTAVRLFMPGHPVGFDLTVYQPFNLAKNLIQVGMKGRAEIESFMLRLAMIVSGDALSSPVANMPTVVDAQDVLLTMAIFRGRLEEMEHSDERFVLTLELAQ